MLWIIVDKETQDVIGKVISNQSITFETAMCLAGFKWFSVNKSGHGDSDGWSNDNGRTIWDESVADLVCVESDGKG